MLQSDCRNVIDLRAYRDTRVRQIVHSWPEDWVEPAQRTRFTLEWLPGWFALVAVVADERRRAADSERRKQA